PFENISQNDYWRFAAFFSRVGSVTYGSVDEIKLDENGVVKHPRTEQEVTPRVCGAAYGTAESEYVKGEAPRLKLADWMAAPDNPYFARAICNRLVGHFFGGGPLHPVGYHGAPNPGNQPA